MVRVGYGCCTNSLERVSRWITPRVGAAPLIIMWNQVSITHAYNQIIDTARREDWGMLVLLHDDLELTDPDAEVKLYEVTTQPNVALVGVAGGQNNGTLAWWNGSTVGRQLTDSQLLDFGPRTGDVTLLEGSLLALSRWSIEHLRFDEDFTGFHGYDEIAKHACALSKRVTVADVGTHHHTQLGFDSIESERAWLAADELYRAKWYPHN